MFIHKPQLLRPIPILYVKTEVRPTQYTILRQITFVEIPEDRLTSLRRVHYPRSPTSLPQHLVRQGPVSRRSSEQWPARARKRHNVVDRRECGRPRVVSWSTCGSGKVARNNQNTAMIEFGTVCSRSRRKQTVPLKAGRFPSGTGRI